MIDDVVQLSFEEGEAVITGQPRISKGHADTLRRAGIDYYPGFLLKGTDEETGGETYYAGFLTARISEEEGRTYFVRVPVHGIGSWVLYAGAADGMRKARVRRSSGDFLAGQHNFVFELSGARYELVVPYSREKSAAIVPQGKMRRELEPLLTVFEAQDRATSAYHAGKAAQEIERANAGVQAMTDQGLVQIVRKMGRLEIRGLPIHHVPYSLAASPETGTYYLVAEAVVPRQTQEEKPDTLPIVRTAEEEYESRWLGGFKYRQSPIKPQAPNPYKLFTGQAEALAEVTGMHAGSENEPRWHYADTFTFPHEGHPVKLVIEQLHADHRVPLAAVLMHYAAEGSSTPTSVQPLKLLLSGEDITQQIRRHFGLSGQTDSPASPVFRYEVRL